ncbi:DUF4173 domain-containing protein [Sphingomonas sp. 2SG]|uniref:DUF4153 domain-containing protein n=1 Tax=Sphingomonas sp. 2SG TaxID=2502201 RepID=UPI0020165EFC|nr:DUF4173 domain-containing protein [Sphingomonas sp. 2SG]
MAKIATTAALIALVEAVIADASILLSLAALIWVAALCLMRPAVRRDRAASIAAAAAAAFVLAIIDDPSPLAVLLFLVAITLAALLPRRRFDNAATWAVRLVWLGITALVGPLRDLGWVGRAQVRRRVPGVQLRAVAAALVLPIAGGALFLALFANANPLVALAFADIALPDAATAVWRGMLAVAVLLPVWMTLRPHPAVTAWDGPAGAPALPQTGIGTLILSLATFNAIFAIQNGLDIAFLWSGAPLPAGVTMADYAHRGAYALIVTALLAALFVLVTLRPGSASAAHPLVRRLVSVWIAQNLLLVASSALRLIDYVDAYGMTVLRLAALIWMTLVATGLALILWRLLAARSAAWLINANALAAALVLAACTVVDLGATAAAWNVRVALARGRAGPPLDLCYLERLGSSALLPLATLERHAGTPALRDRLATLRWTIQTSTAAEQASWHGWTFRNARRLAAVAGIDAPRHYAPRSCDGRLTKDPQR